MYFKLHKISTCTLYKQNITTTLQYVAMPSHLFVYSCITITRALGSWLPHYHVIVRLYIFCGAGEILCIFASIWMRECIYRDMLVFHLFFSTHWDKCRHVWFRSLVANENTKPAMLHLSVIRSNEDSSSLPLKAGLEGNCFFISSCQTQNTPSWLLYFSNFEAQGYKVPCRHFYRC